MNGASYVLGAPDVLDREPASWRCRARSSTRCASTPPPGAGWSPSPQARGPLPADPAHQPPPPLEPKALVVLEETLRPDAAETIEFMRDQQVDLKLISGDARETVTAVAHAVGVPQRRAA